MSEDSMNAMVVEPAKPKTRAQYAARITELWLEGKALEAKARAARKPRSRSVIRRAAAEDVAPQSTLETKGYVYFIQAGENGPIKIGTAVIPEDRLRTLQTGNHETLRLLAYTFGDAQEESRIHTKFAHLRRGKSEWFDCADALMALIKEIQQETEG